MRGVLSPKYCHGTLWWPTHDQRRVFGDVKDGDEVLSMQGDTATIVSKTS
jgi:hypothetical protein